MQAQAMRQAEQDAVQGYIVAPARANQHTRTVWNQVAAQCEQRMQQIRQGIPGLAQHADALVLTARVTAAQHWHGRASAVAQSIDM